MVEVRVATVGNVLKTHLLDVFFGAVLRVYGVLSCSADLTFIKH